MSKILKNYESIIRRQIRKVDKVGMCLMTVTSTQEAEARRMMQEV
jgi:hypothetical protein